MCLCLQGGGETGPAWLPRRKRPDQSPPPPVSAATELPVRASVLPGGAREEAAGAGRGGWQRLQLADGQRALLFLQPVGTLLQLQRVQDLPA